MKKFIYLSACLFLLFASYILSDMYTTQELRIFYARTLPQDHQFNYDHPFQEIFLDTAPNARINALHFKVENPKGVVLYFHGQAWHLGAKKPPNFPEQFLERGYDVFVMDYRGFGKSTGPTSEAALHHDAEFIYDHLLKSYAENQITVYGMSLGTSVATKLASCRHPKQLILEAPYSSMLDMAVRTVPYVPKWITRVILKYHLRTDLFIKKVRCPTHLFHGSHDERIPHLMSEKLISRIKKGVNATLYTINGGDHAHLPHHHEFIAHLDSLLHPGMQTCE